MATRHPAAVRRRPRALAALGEALGRRLRPRVVIAGRSRPVYGLCVCGGAALGAGAIVALGTWRGVSPLLALGSAAAGIAAALALAFATKAATGGERFTFYHYQLAVLAAAGGLLAAAGGPVLVHLDLVAIGLAVAHAIGRLGCLAAGCCHGRATPWGVRYREEHAADGFPRELVGVPLAPVQAAESLAVTALALGGGVLVIAGSGAGGAAPGTALALYVAGYGAVRFLLERWRGDRRPGWVGLSEAQWTALAAVAAVVALGAARVLPIGAAGIATGTALLLLLAAVALADRRRLAGGLLAGAHATEVAVQLARLLQEEARSPWSGTRVPTSDSQDGAAAAGTGIPASAWRDRDATPALPASLPAIGTTSRRLRLSTSLIRGPERPLRVVSLSAAAPPLPAAAADGLARLVLRQLGAGGESELRRGGHGVWHLLVPAAAAEKP